MMRPRLGTLLKRFSMLASLWALAAMTFAVSLGDELILSRLGDPVEIEIEVLQWEDMDLDRVQISAATREEYAVFDLTWLPVLEDLRFNLVGPDLDGDVRVLISSLDPLNEPFLELLLVLRWPGGSLRREYVLLFDPPGAPVATLPVDDDRAPTQLAPPTVVDEIAPDATVISVEREVVRTEPAVQAPEVVQPAVAVPPVSAPITAPPVAVPPVTVEEPAAEISEQPVADISEEPAAEVSEEPAAEITEEPAAGITAQPAAPFAVVAGVDEPVVPDARTQTAIEVETLAPQAPVALDTTRRVYQVRPGDSLWNIARQFRPAGAGENLYQMLLSIHDLNRNAFINGNISLLKANAVLQIPSEVDIDAIDALVAEAEFDRRWELGTQRFDAVQRGEAIPLFANAIADEPVIEVEDELPPGIEAPVTTPDEDALIMVSADAPQPLQIATAATTGTVEDVSVDANTEPAVGNALDVPESAPVMVSSNSFVALPVATTNESATTQTQVRVLTRAAFAVELESELSAMRARRESAEALAKQLQASLQQAQAERAARSSLVGTENIVLAGSAALLLVALLAAVVVTLKLASDLRIGSRSLAAASLESRTEPAWMSATSTDGNAQHKAARDTDVAAREMEVVELQATPAARASHDADRANTDEDLFARMEDLLVTGADSPKTG